ncbi:MAG: serine hydrolase [Planctomycetes bacterium]|jgi:hypothetical protein|nr:serine hydrolase [Planctomycetota bacterium]
MKRSSARIRSRALGVAALLGLLATAAPALGADELLRARMKDLQGLFCAKPEGIERLFHESFLKAVPAAKIAALLQGLFEKNGACTEAALLKVKPDGTGAFELVFEKGVAMPSTLNLEAAPPHKVTGWWIGPPMPAARTLEDVAAELRKLPGSVSFAAARLGDKDPEVLASLNPDLPLAIGSSFKLYVLGAVSRAVEEGRLRWDAAVPLKEEWRSFPSGSLHEWPPGAPVTVHTLASLMISVSDNTATDHLLFTAGRKAVEAALEPMGSRNAARNVPFLSTQEMFKLKVGPGGLAKAFLGKSAEERRAFLEGEVRALPRASVSLAGFDRPRDIDTIEWFASASDLVRAMDFLRRAAEKPGQGELLGILSINKGLPFEEAEWPFVGFKGGSEPGVLNGTFLLRSGKGAWFAVSASWNDPAKDVDAEKLFGVLLRVFRILAKG